MLRGELAEVPLSEDFLVVVVANKKRINSLFDQNHECAQKVGGSPETIVVVSAVKKTQ